MALELDRWGRPARRRWLELILLIGFLLSLVVGIGALAVIFALGEVTEPTPPAEALSALQVDRIPPQYALLELAGDPKVALARQAIDAGQTETAYAQIIFATDLTDSQRTGLLLLLARRMREIGDRERAAQVYGLARTTAVLAPTLTPVERAQALTECAGGLLAVDEPEQAVEAADQARLVAAQAGDLLPVQRSQIFRSLTPFYQAAGADERVREMDELQRSAGPVDPGVVLPDLWGTLSQPYLPTVGNATVYTETQALLGQIVAQRQQAARVLVERIGLTDGLDIEPERAALIQALENEDRVRGEIFHLGRGAGPSLAEQHWLLQTHRAWLAQKVRMAVGGFGLRLVPAWTDNPTPLLQDLGNTTADLQAILAAQVQAQTDPVAGAVLRHQTLAWLALQSESGMFPGSVESGLVGEIGAALLAAQAELTQQGYPLALPLSYTPSTDGPDYAFTQFAPNR
jgi:hypothetical protein